MVDLWSFNEKQWELESEIVEVLVHIFQIYEVKCSWSKNNQWIHQYDLDEVYVIYIDKYVSVHM